MELTRGEVGDRPWGRTLGTLWTHRLTGQLTVVADDWRYCIAFDAGNLIGATSPDTVDDPVHIAFRAGLVDKAQVDAIARAHAEQPDADDIELLARIANLPSEVALKIRRRAVAHAAARTFSLERGTFVVDDRITIPIVAGGDFDARAIVYFGARNNMSLERLSRELDALGAWFVLAPNKRTQLAQYGFPNLAQGALDLLATGARLGDIDAWCPELDPHASRAMVYALVAFEACAARDLSNLTPLPEMPRSIVRTVTGPVGTRSPTPPWLPALPETPPPAPAPAPPAASTRVPVVVTGARGSGPLLASRSPSDPYVARRAIQAVLEDRIARGVDHFELLGVSYDATAAAIRTAYLGLVRQLRPDLELGNVVARSLFAQVAKAFGVINDAGRRAVYLERIQATKPHVRISPRGDDPAEEAYGRGEHALVSGRHRTAIEEFKRAIDLQPGEAKYHALLAWSQFCSAADKTAMAGDTRAALAAAMEMPGDALVARYYLGRVERMLDHEDEALKHFQAVLERDPSHREAASEVRELTRRR